MNTLDRLKELTQALPPFPETITANAADSFTQHEMSKGTCLSWSLLNRPEISVAKWFNSKGTEFPEHAHAQKEWLIVYIGEIVIHVEGQGDVVLRAGDYLHLEPGVVHSATVNSDCWYLAITIPQNEDWPV